MTPPSEHERNTRAATAATQESGPPRPQLMQDPEQRAHKAALAAQLFGEAPAAVKVGRFRVLERLGEGGMGVVFSGYDDELDRRVAIKLLHWTRHEDRDARARLRREAQALARLSHPNVVQLFEVGEHEGRMFVAMEQVAGETLHAWLRAHKGPRPWREVLDRFVAAGRGLAAAHAVGLVHRDFKPSNVILGADGRVRVLDFGLARAAGEQEAPGTLPGGHVAEDSRSPLATPLTMTGGVLGTPAYMAPEQFSGRCDARSDQFGFCVALFEALYGERPFAGTRPVEIMAAIERGVPAKVSPGKVPGWLHAAVVRGLSREPEDRWPSMPALLDELGRDRDGRRRIRVVGLTAGLGATAAVFGAALGIGQVQESRRVAACEALGAEISEVWGPAQRERLIAGYAAKGTGAAQIAMQEWIETIDQHAERWRWRRVEGCVSPSSEVREWPYMERNVEQCFARARDQLATLVEVATRTTPALKDPFAYFAWYAPGVDGCVDDRQIKAFVAEDPALRGRRQEIRGRMIEGDLAAQDGRTQEAEALLSEALAAARELEDAELAQTGSRLLVRARFAGGRRRQAWDALIEGVPWAKGLGEEQMGLWRSELRAPLLLGEAAGRRGAGILAIVESVGVGSPIPANVRDAVHLGISPDGAPLWRTKDFEATSRFAWLAFPAIAAGAQALVGIDEFDVAEEAARVGLTIAVWRGEDPAVLGDLFLALGRARTGLGRYGEAMNALEAARAYAERAGTAKRGWIALAFAELRLAAGDVAGARTELAAAEGLAAEIEADDDRFAPALALLRAELQVRDGEPAQAEELLQAARRGLGDSHGVARWMLVETDLALGRLALAQGRLALADDQLGEALRVGETLAGRQHVGLAPILLELGRLGRAQGELAGSREAIERALALIERRAVAADVRRDMQEELGRTLAARG